MVNTSFIFDGVESDEYGIEIVNMGSGIVANPFMGGQSIMEESIKGRGMPVFYGTQREPISFSVTFALPDVKLNSSKLYDLANWLMQDE